MSGCAESARLMIEVAYAQADRAVLARLAVPAGATIADVLELAAERAEFSGIDLPRATVGIFGRITPRNRLVEEGDRVEIYRPLAIDPKAARRARARESRKKP